MSELPFLETTDGRLILSVYVQPSARKDEVCGLHAGSLKIRLNAPPVDGKANKRLTEYLSKLFGIKKSSVEIISGQTSRTKRVKLSGIKKERAEGILSALID